MIEVKHLRSAVALAEHGNFARAAADLGLHQSAVSLNIKALEKEVGVRLFKRTRGRDKTSMTAAGTVFVAHARDIIARLELAQVESARVGRGVSGRLVVGFLAASLVAILPRTLERLAVVNSAISVEPREFLTTPASVRAVLEGMVDVGIGRPPFASIGTPATTLVLPLGAETTCVVVPRTHRLANMAEVPVRELASESLIATPLEERYPGYLGMLGAAAGFEPKIVAHVQGIHTVLGMVEAGLGIGLAPSSVGGLVGRPNCVVRRLSPTLMAPPLCVFWRRDDPRGVVRDFVQAIRDVTGVEAEAQVDLDYDRKYLSSLRLSLASV